MTKECVACRITNETGDDKSIAHTCGLDDDYWIVKTYDINTNTSTETKKPKYLSIQAAAIKSNSPVEIPRPNSFNLLGVQVPVTPKLNVQPNTPKINILKLGLDDSLEENLDSTSSKLPTLAELCKIVDGDSAERIEFKTASLQAKSCTDVDLARALYALSEGELIYCNKEYYLWNKLTLLWDKTVEEIVIKQVFDLFDDYYNEFARQVDPEGLDFKVIHKMRIQVKINSHRNAIFNCLKSFIIKPKFKGLLDPVSTLIPLNNGELFNIFTHESITRNKSHFYSKTINAKFDNTIDTSVAYDFFNKLMCEQQIMTQFLIQLLAVYITSDMSDKSFAIMYGDGDNGKSVLISVLKALLGDFYYAANGGVFFQSKSNNANAHTSHLNSLKTKRLCSFSETERCQKLNEPQIKSLTGNDTITIRQLCKEESNLQITSHFILLTNQLPEVSADKAFSNRCRLIPFKAKFVKQLLNPAVSNEYLADFDIINKLTTADNLTAIFTLLAQAAKQYYDNKFKLSIPDEVHAATQEFITDSFPYADFLNEECVVDPTAEISATLLYQAYTSYTHPSDTQTKFGSIIGKKFTKKKSHGIYVYIGIKLKGHGVQHNFTIKEVNSTDLTNYLTKQLK